MVSDVLRDCFETTDWDVLCRPHREDIDSLTHCITDYLNFCVENTVPTKKVLCFSNNKPWVTSELKALLNKKKRLVRSGGREELRRVQKQIRREVRKGKISYREKVEEHLQHNNIRERGSSTLPPSNLSLTVDRVKKELKKMKTRKAMGPDGISSRLLKTCADQLSEVVLRIFNLSLWSKLRSFGRLLVWFQYQNMHTPGSPTILDW
ncbi:unnamed protein product [Leuciscus chuanchicus]